MRIRLYICPSSLLWNRASSRAGAGTVGLGRASTTYAGAPRGAKRSRRRLPENPAERQSRVTAGGAALECAGRTAAARYRAFSGGDQLMPLDIQRPDLTLGIVGTGVM